MEHIGNIQHMLFTYQSLVWNFLHGFLINFWIPSIPHRLIVALAIKIKIFRWLQALHEWHMYSATSSNYTLSTLLPHWISFCSANITHVLIQPRVLLLLSSPLIQLVYFLLFLQNSALGSLLLVKFPLHFARLAPSPNPLFVPQLLKLMVILCSCLWLFNYCHLNNLKLVPWGQGIFLFCLFYLQHLASLPGVQ